jgi:hypothetical protein
LTGSDSTTHLTGSSASLSGTSSSPSWPPANWVSPANINDIHAVEYRLNGGAWTLCSASDGAFDENDEGYTCAINGLGDGNYLTEVRATNRTGISSSPPYPSLTLIRDLNGPSGSVSINSSASYTTSTAATLTLAANDAGSGVAQMRFSNDALTWSIWETYATSKNWTLTSGEGAKTVFAQYKDNHDNVSTSYNAGILLDTLPPQVTVTNPTISASHIVSVSWSALESGSGQVVYDVQFRIGVLGAWVDWLTGTDQTSTSFGPQIPGSSDYLTEDSILVFRVRARDAAGNTSSYVETNPSQEVYCLFLPVAVR